MRDRITYANVVATLALFLALGGGAYAVTGGASATGSGRYTACVKRRGGAMRLVTSARACRPRTERAIAWNVTGPRGLQGANGVPGAPGLDGKQGAPGATRVRVVTGNSNTQAGPTATCPAGTVAVGGGAERGNNGYLTRSRPTYDGSNRPTGWVANESDDGSQFQFAASVYAICASP